MRRPFRFIALTALLAALLVPTGLCPAQTKGKEKVKSKDRKVVSGYKRETIRGFTHPADSR
jgi:hypothetical protein